VDVAGLEVTVAVADDAVVTDLEVAIELLPPPPPPPETPLLKDSQDMRGKASNSTDAGQTEGPGGV
jgi:hypothetical protein